MFDELKEELKDVENWLEIECGFDRVHNLHFEVRKSGQILYVSLHDNFQESMHFDHKQWQGLQSFHFDNMHDLWAQLRKVPGRKMRELRVLAATSQSLAGIESAMQSAAGREFAHRIAAEAASLKNLLEVRS